MRKPLDVMQWLPRPTAIAYLPMALATVLCVNSAYNSVLAQPVTPQSYQPAYQPADAYEARLYRYAELQQQAATAFNNGQLSQAIVLFEQALPLAEEGAQAVATNNLAAAYIRRGSYYANTLKDWEQALEDYRQAVYWLSLGWPMDEQGTPQLKKPVHQENERIASTNLTKAYEALGVAGNGPDAQQQHELWAKQLRQQGKLRSALVEIQALQAANPTNYTWPQTLGDLFGVLNQPAQSAFYYSKALELSGSKAPPALQLQNALALYKQGNAPKATEVLNTLIETDPHNEAALALLERIWREDLAKNPNKVVAHANLASIFQKQNRPELALKAYINAEQLASKDPTISLATKKEIRLNLGTLYEQTSQPAMAEEAYQSVLRIENTDAGALSHLAGFYLANRQPEKVLAPYFNALQSPGLLPLQQKTLQTDLTALLSEAPQPQPAFGLWEQLAESLPRQVWAQTQVGQWFHSVKNYPLAQRYYQQALALNPPGNEAALLWANLGAVYQAQNQPAQALTALEKAQQLAPVGSASAQTVTQSLNQLKASQAYQAYQQATALLQPPSQPQSTISPEPQTTALIEPARLEEAFSLLKQASDLDPAKVDYPLALAVAYQQQNRLPEALTAYDEALNRFPTEASLLYSAATAFQADNQLAKARRLYQKALAQTPDMPEARTALTALNQQEIALALTQAYEAYEQKRFSATLAWADKVLAINNKEATAFYYKGLAYEGLNKPTLAVGQYQKAVAFKPTFYDGFYALGLAYEGLKQPWAAKKAYQQYWQLVTAGPAAEVDEAQKTYVQSRLRALR